MRAALALSLALLAACSSAPEVDSPEGEDHLEFQGVPKDREVELRELVASDLKRYLQNPRETVLDDAVYRLKYHYQFDGYADVEVSYEMTAARVIFKVREGPRYTLGRVHFDGNSVFSDEELKGLRPKGVLGEAVPFSERLMVMIREEAVAAYRKKGYFEAEVEIEERRAPDDPGRVHVTFHVKEGRGFVLAGIDGVPDSEELRKALSEFPGRPYTPASPEVVEATVIDELRDHGHPFAQALATPKIDRETATVRLELEVLPGPAARIGSLRITGSRRTRDSFVESRADLQPGESYRASDLRRAEERLQKTQLFRAARVSPGTLKEETGELNVDVSLDEKDPGEFAIRGGYGTHEGLRAGADLAHTNLLGGAELLRVGGTVSTLGYRTDAELAFPYLLGTDFRPGFTSWLEDREFPTFDSRSYGVVGELAYPLMDQLVTRTGLRYAIIRTDNVEPGVPPGDLLDFAYTAVFWAFSADFVDNPRLPTSGIRASAEVDWSPEGFRSDVVFLSASGRVTAFIPLPLDLVLASSFQGGIILPRGKTQEIPISLRYFAGGATTVRGFELDSIGSSVNGEPTGGEVLLAVQSEIRFPLWGDFHGAVFSDQGSVWFDHNRVALDETRWSLGAGLRYYTAAGAFVADFGWNPHREPGERPMQFHFSIGFPF